MRGNFASTEIDGHDERIGRKCRSTSLWRAPLGRGGATHEVTERPADGGATSKALRGGAPDRWSTVSSSEPLDHDRNGPADGVADRRVLLSVCEQIVELLLRAVRLHVHADADLFVAWRDLVIEAK
jgi:hypothetical protein